MNLQTHSASNTQSSKAPAILQTASLLAFVQYAAHGSLFLLSITAHPSPIAAIAASSHHSYWDFYVGYGLLAILSGVVEAVLIWQVALLAKNNAARVMPIVVLFIFANLAHAGLVWIYFSLIAPVAFDLLIAACLGLPLFRRSRERSSWKRLYESKCNESSVS